MKTIVTLALLAGMLTAAPVFAQGANIDDLCGPGGPDAYKRAGGYCETLGHGSISGRSGGAAVGEGIAKEDEFDTPCGEWVCKV